MNVTQRAEDAIQRFSEKELGDVKILMVEDDVFFSEMVLAKLSQQGCIPYSTPTGEEAVELATQYQPDVIILDLMLPGISGEEVLVKLKSSNDLKDIPVIVFSNKSDDACIQENLEAGACRYLVKSSTGFDLLVKTVKEVVEEAKAS